MENEFIYWPHHTPVGIKIEEVSGTGESKGRLWEEMARQIYCEHGADGYREIGYFSNGAPFIAGLEARISITHTSHLFVVAMLPRTPEADLRYFSPRTAMGVDAESLDRAQVLKIRSKFLSEKELEIIPDDSIEKNVMAWTAKEAVYKASMTEGLDFRTQIIIEKLPELDGNVALPHSADSFLGKARLILDGEKGREEHEMILYSYESDGYCVTLGFSPKCAKFGKK